MEFVAIILIGFIVLASGIRSIQSDADRTHSEEIQPLQAENAALILSVERANNLYQNSPRKRADEK